MADPFIGEIRLFGFPRVPIGWAACDGSSIQIADNPALYQLLGTIYGGDGVSTFNLPDLRGRVPLSQGTGNGLTPRQAGQASGEEYHSLLIGEMPSHGHGLVATAMPGTTASPGPTVQFATASSSSAMVYAPATAVSKYQTLATSIAPTGHGQPHYNMMPTLTCSYCISLYGAFPSQS